MSIWITNLSESGRINKIMNRHDHVYCRVRPCVQERIWHTWILARWPSYPDASSKFKSFSPYDTYRNCVYKTVFIKVCLKNNYTSSKKMLLVIPLNIFIKSSLMCLNFIFFSLGANLLLLCSVLNIFKGVSPQFGTF